jgi:hypothetical protein
MMMTEAEMLDIATRALLAQNGMDPDDPKTWEGDAETLWALYRADARAVFAALAEAGFVIVPPDGPYQPNENTVRIPVAQWRKFQMSLTKHGG